MSLADWNIIIVIVSIFDSHWIDSIYFRLTQYKLKFFAFFEKQIQAHNMNFDEDSESRDYVEAYLKEKKKHEDAGDYESYW